MVQSQDPDVRLISQIDIVMCFIYNMSVSWGYGGWCHSNKVTISECPLGNLLQSGTMITMWKLMLLGKARATKIIFFKNILRGLLTIVFYCYFGKLFVFSWYIQMLCIEKTLSVCMCIVKSMFLHLSYIKA